jgi:hypothetical protein
MSGGVATAWYRRFVFFVTDELKNGPEREYLRGKYHCTIDLLFDWFGISCMTTRQFLFLLAKQTNPKQSNRRSMV